jgi:RNA polymerase sigma factor (TIGR02999 family)
MSDDGVSGRERDPRTSPGEVTELLFALRRGDPEAFDSLVPLVYDDLRRIARRQLARSRPGATLDTTALVHEAYLKMVDHSRVEFQDRDHFFAVAARAMRQILVDHARRRRAGKRGGGRESLSLERVEIGLADDTEWLLALDEALTRMSDLDQRLTRVFECRFFAGLSEQETANALEMTLRTVQRDWRKSRLWLRRELGAQS